MRKSDPDVVAVRVVSGEAVSIEGKPQGAAYPFTRGAHFLMRGECDRIWCLHIPYRVCSLIVISIMYNVNLFRIKLKKVLGIIP